MNAVNPPKKKSFPTRQTIEEAADSLSQASEKLDNIRDYYNMEWGDNRCCDLDLAITYALQKIDEAQDELQTLLRLKRIGLNYRGGRTWV